MPRNGIVTLVTLLALAGVGYALVPAAQPRELAPRYLFAWVGDDDREDSDFLAVIDLVRQGDRYGTIVATTAVGEKGLWPHHTEHTFDSSRMLFANGFAANRTLLFDLHDPLRPKSSSGSTARAT